MHAGDISTYEAASDAYLQKRKEDLRASIRNPHLSAGEFIQSVVSQATISALAVAYSGWMGLEKLLPIFGESKVAQSMGFVLRRKIRNEAGEKRQRTFAYEINEYRSDFATSGQNWAQFYYEPRTAQTTEAFVEQELRNMGRHRFESGRSGLQTFLDKTLRGPEAREKRQTYLDEARQELTEAAEQEMKAGGKKGKAIIVTEEQVEAAAHLKFERWARGQLMGDLEKVSHDHPNAHLTRIFKLLTKVEEKHDEHNSPVRLIESLVTFVEDVAQDLKENNEHILNRYRGPIVGTAVAAAVGITGWRAYRTARRDKTLGEETEMSHIERIQAERALQKEKGEAPAVSA